MKASEKDEFFTNLFVQKIVVKSKKSPRDFQFNNDLYINEVTPISTMKSNYYLPALLSILSLFSCTGEDGGKFIPITLDLASISNPPKIIKFQTKEEQIYEIDIAFPYKEDDQQDRSRVQKIIDESSKDRHMKSLIYMSASLHQTSEDGSFNFRKINFTSKEREISSWTGNAFFKEVDYFRLKKGSYELRIDEIAIDSSLTSENIQLKIVKAYRGK